jgi:general secretion pathway protein I
MSFCTSRFSFLREPVRRAARRLAASEGFTLIEVLVALTVLAIVIGAIGEVVGTTVKGIRSVDRRLPLLETAQNLLASLPERAALQPGAQTGGSGDFRWRVDVVPLTVSVPSPKTGAAPLPGTEQPAAQQPQWQPYAITIRVQGSDGPPVRLDTVRLAPIQGAQKPAG